MIKLPLKTPEASTWSGHLNPALSLIYGSAGDFQEEIEKLDKMRESINGGSLAVQGRALFRYYGQIELLSLHISMRPFHGSFAWKNLYDDEVIEQSSIAFEKACVLYNIAAVLTQDGENAVGTQESAKAAGHAYACAAGILQSVSSNFLHAACTDLQPRTLEALSKLMLAQGQECYFHMAVFTKKGNGLVAKLATSAATLYSQTADQLRQIYDEDYWGEKADIKACEARARELKASAHEFQAQVSEVSQKFGDAIAHMREAKRLESEKATIEDLTRKIRALERDNDLIYHDRVPSEAPEISGLQAVKPQPLESLYSAEEASRIIGKDLFEKVVPVAVHEKASMYSELKAEALRTQQEKVEVANFELTSALDYMDLPASISRLKPASLKELKAVPPEVLEWSMIVSSSPLPKNIDFDDQRQRILSLVRSDPNPEIKQRLVVSAKTDKELQKLHAEIMPTIQQLSNSRSLPQIYASEIDQAIAVEGSNLSLLDIDDSQDFGQSLEEVSEAVVKLRKIMSGRNNAVKELREATHKDDITQIIVGNQHVEDIGNTVFKPELAKFEPYIKRIDATIRLQNAVLNDTVEHWKKVLEKPQAKQVAADRERAAFAGDALTDRFKNAYHQWLSLRESYERAKTFYSSLERQAMGAPPIPPKPPVPPKKGETNVSGYTTPSAYNPSMYR